MRHPIASLLFVVCILCVASELECYKILAIVPTPSYSHQIPYRKLWIELNSRGHDVTLVTANPIKNYKAPNFHQVDISECYKVLREIDFVKLRFEGKNWIQFCDDYMVDMSITFAEAVFNNTQLRKLYAPESNASFDILMVEMLLMPSMYAFAHRFNVPMIGLSSLGLLSINEYALGGFVLPSHEYTWEMEANTGSNLPFLKRLQNYVNLWHLMYRVYRKLVPEHQRIAEEFMGPIPPVMDILKNTSLIFIDQSDILTPARPKLANMITFTSFHIEDNPAPLPKDLQTFLDEAKEGFIYFSLGSNARSSDLPMEVQIMMCDVFAKLPYRVVWKYDGELPNKPKNIYTSSWFVQQRILAHPNIKLFIYQGGLQSSEETVQFGVPIIGFPILADQDYQVARMDALGVGKRLEITTVTKDEFEAAILEVITDKKYKQRILEVRKRVLDQPYDLVKNLAWWTEYVIRTEGAPHLRSSLAWQPWYQRYDMDIVVFLTVVVFFIVTNALNLIAKLIVHVHNRLRNPANRKQKTS